MTQDMPVRLNEGKIKKGGLNPPPKGERPSPPAALKPKSVTATRTKAKTPHERKG